MEWDEVYKTCKKHGHKLEDVDIFNCRIKGDQEEKTPEFTRVVAVDVKNRKIIGCASLKKVLLKEGDFVFFRQRSSENREEKPDNEVEKPILLTADLIDVIIKKKVFMVGTDAGDIKNLKNKSIKDYLKSQGTHVVVNFKGVKTDSETVYLTLK